MEPELGDSLNRLVGATSTTGLSATYHFDAFGNREAAIEAIEQPYGYTGREFDAETGLYHYRARSYDPQSGNSCRTIRSGSRQAT